MIGPLRSEVRRVLEAGGWTSGRRVPAPTAELTAEGYTVSDAAISVLAELGGLEFHPPTPPDPLFATGPFWFGLDVGERDRVEEWETWLEEPLTIVGEWSDWYFLTVSPRGRVYAGAGDQLLLVGDSIELALEAMVLANRPLLDVAPASALRARSDNP